LDEQDKEFLIQFKEGIPDWHYFSVPHIKDLPAVKWKILNLNQLGKDKRRQMVNALIEYFE